MFVIDVEKEGTDERYTVLGTGVTLLVHSPGRWKTKPMEYMGNIPVIKFRY